MKITGIRAQAVDVPLTRPYAVASHRTDVASMLLVRIDTDAGVEGFGAATPEPTVNGDTRALALATIDSLVVRGMRGTLIEVEPVYMAGARGIRSAAARAAIDMALYDLWGKARGRPLCELLGRVHAALPTSVTLGIRDVADTLAEAREYLQRGFLVLKVKIGHDLDLDVERLVRLRELVGAGIGIRVDGNVGYTQKQLLALLQRTAGLDLQFVEQPLPVEAVDAQRLLPPAMVARLMADESLHDAADALALCRPPRPFGLFNIKLMKCGGIAAAREIAVIAHQAGIGLMWGCMDESRIGIAAALHAALSCPATHYLDLDGSLDLARDFASGGFALEAGVMRPLDQPGLGLVVDAW